MCAIRQVRLKQGRQTELFLYLSLKQTFFLKTGLFVVYKCPSSYPPAQSDGFLCEFLEDFDNMYHEDGVYYKNKYCFQCWQDAESDSTLIKLLKNTRRQCIPNLDDCNIGAGVLTFQGCMSSQSPVMYVPSRKTGLLPIQYRNINCFHCNSIPGIVDYDQLFCYDPDFPETRMDEKLEVLQADYLSSPDVTKVLKSVILDNARCGMPDSISILVNFGARLKKVLYNAGRRANGCYPDQLWDPFAGICRQVYCKTSFNLDTLNCDPKKQTCSNTTDCSEESDDDDDNIILPSSKMVVQMTALIFKTPSMKMTTTQVAKAIEDNFVTALSSSLEFSPSRMQNFQVNSGVTVSLTQPDEVIKQLVLANIQLIRDAGYNQSNIIGSDEIRTAVTAVDDLISEAYEFNISWVMAEKSDSDQDYEASTNDLLASMAELVSSSSYFHIEVANLSVRIIELNEASVYNDSLLDKWCW